MEREFDIVVVGSGVAGTGAATSLQKHGFRVAVIEERAFGGTCALRGCDPKKVLVAAARSYVQSQRYRKVGVFDSVPTLNWSGLMRFKRTFTDPVPAKRVQSFRDLGIEPIHGRASFIDRNTIAVGKDRIHGKRFVIATGAEARHVARGDDQLLTSDSFLDLEAMPGSLLFVGGGYIAFELAHVAASAGSAVTILNDTDRPLRSFDPDAVACLMRATRDAGISIELNVRVKSVERDGDGVRLSADTPDGTRTFAAKDGVLAAGRVANLDALDLGAGGIERTKKGVKVDARMQSVSNPSVFAAGDCADGGGLPLTPVAGYEGELVAQNMIDDAAKQPHFRGLASIVYTIPPLAQVGLTEDHAREQGVEVDVHEGDMSDWYSLSHIAADAGYYKLLVTKAGGLIVGGTVFGPQAEELINVLALAVHQKLDAKTVGGVLYAYPTGASDLQYFV